MQSKMSCLKLVFAVLALFHHVTAQTVTLSSSEGTNLQERSDPYQICVTLLASPSGGDLTVSLTSSAAGIATSPEDFQLSTNMLIFVDGTSELQQCIDLTVVDDNLVEQDEFFSLMATPSSGSTATQIFFIRNNDNALIGLDQNSYTVNETDASVRVCVVFLMNSGIQDATLTVEATISATDGTAIAVEDYGQPLPSSVTLSSTTPASGACSTINIPQDATVEGRETFSVTVTAGVRAQVVDGRGTAQVVIVDGCGPLPPPENGNVDASITTIGSVANYSCDNGFLISGVSQRICQTDGFWSESAPSCSIVCESLNNQTNGEVVINDSTRVVGSVATYNCDGNFFLSGSIMRECQDNGTWSGDEPLCIERPSTGPVSNQNRNIGIGVGVGVGGFLLILLIVIVIAVLILALKKKNTEKYVLNYSTVYGKGSGVGSTGNDYSSAPSSVPDGGENGSNGVQERSVDVGEDEETSAITFKEE